MEISSPSRVNPFIPLTTPGSQQDSYCRTLQNSIQNKSTFLLPEKSKHTATTNAFEPILMWFSWQNLTMR